MSQNRNFHQALGDLARANALDTLGYLCTEAERALAHAKAYIENHDSRPLVLWPDEAERMIDVLQHPHSAFAIVDADGTVLQCNNNMAKPLGCANAQAMLGCNLWDLPGMKQRSERQATFDAVIQSRRPKCEIMTNGHDQPIEACILPLSAQCVMLTYRPVSVARAFHQAFKPSQPTIIE